MSRILIIDDDDLLRELLAVTLTGAGHSVIQMSDGRQAVDCPDADLVITDLVMPDREGLETIAALHRKRPALPIVAMSGAASDSGLYLKMADSLGASRTLTKPFALSALLGVINELLPRLGAQSPAVSHENSPSRR